MRAYVDWWRRRSGCHGDRGSGNIGREIDWTGDSETLLFVSFQHVGESETLATNITRVWFLSRVGSAMALHVWSACETFSADFTNKWLFTSVSLHVLIKILFHVEILATPLAHKLFMTNMNTHVRAELILVLKSFITVLTFERFFS